MKVRNGFVSNSSSSSFILGREIDFNSITPALLKQEKSFVLVGKELNEGTDVFKISTVDEIALVKAISRLNIFQFKAYSIVRDVDTWNHIQQDNCSCMSYDDILLKYSKDWSDPEKSERVKKQIEAEKQVFLRSEKIKKIENES